MGIIFPDELKRLVLNDPAFKGKIFKKAIIPQWVESMLGEDPMDYRQICFKGYYIIYKKHGNTWKKWDHPNAQGAWF